MIIQYDVYPWSTLLSSSFLITCFAQFSALRLYNRHDLAVTYIGCGLALTEPSLYCFLFCLFVCCWFFCVCTNLSLTKIDSAIFNQYNIWSECQHLKNQILSEIIDSKARKYSVSFGECIRAFNIVISSSMWAGSYCMINEVFGESLRVYCHCTVCLS